ncbi:serine/threonine protein kinase [Kitasatospora gansuensis]|uniref:non-specific serine/threonine protein kinase n=1 Tax=Kitasatospora gansuensis TaxID=258050 RepID=A0A7W7SIC4_9ACTN|nr:serine/threonine protein kinase [Kitasatospora gansuensis]MBB4949826.1 serine/threonine protein kinase [Kitasatospora gansuensis]
MSSQDDGAPDVGRVIADRYLLQEQLGRGGMGTVWMARDTKLERSVAVKELSVSGIPERELPTLNSRMQQEARAAAKIKHPGVITVYDVLEQDGRPWIVMELIDGRSLADVIDSEGTLLPRDAARVGEQVLAALDQAHRHGVLHRDVKPANVLLERGGRAVLTDFGIALLEGAPGLTRTGDIVGSPDYVAPERVSGHRPGPESDLWSLGATLYAAVEGQSPFHRTTTMGTLQAVIADPLPEPRHAGALAPVIEALLRKDPAERPTADQALTMLAEAARTTTGPTQPHAPTQTTPPTPIPLPTPIPQPAPPSAPVPTAPTPSPPAPPGDGHRRRNLLIVACAVLVALLTGGVVFAVVNSGSQKPPQTTTVIAPVTTPPSSQPPATQAPTTQAPTSQPPTSQPPSNPPTTSPLTSPAQTVRPAPTGFRWVDDPAGFRVAVPQNWTRTETGGQIDYSPDGGLHLLRFGISPGAAQSSEAHFLELEQTVGQQTGYQQITLQPNVYRGSPGALWEFSWTDTKRGPRHASDQAFVATNGTEYAIYLAAPEGDWTTARQQFTTVLNTFQPK